jgi:hypothetical protein
MIVRDAMNWEGSASSLVTKLAFSLEGFRRLNTFKAHSDKRQLQAVLNRNGFSDLSELAQISRSPPHPAHCMSAASDLTRR